MITKDVVIIGGGMAGLFTAYSLIKTDPTLSIVIVERGDGLENRRCQSAINKTKCKKSCKACAITSGVAGAGAFSDAKFILGTSYGGTLAEEIGEPLTKYYIEEVDRILEDKAIEVGCTFPKDFHASDEWKEKCIANNMYLLDVHVRHLGTDRNFIIMRQLIKSLEDNEVSILTNVECTSIETNLDDTYTLRLNNNEIISGKYVVIATGRGGYSFVEKVRDYFQVEQEVNNVDIGVRVEMKDIVWRKMSNDLYEPKVVYKTKTFEDKCRMFCFNQGGIVSAETNNGVVTANGHSYADPAKKTDNCNFAILSSITFTEPFNKPSEYVEYISRLANMIGDGGVIIQRFGDLIRGRRTTDSRLAKNSVTPTMKATPGDLSLVLPHRILTNIIETIYALDKISPGTANDDTLLYGCESKYYSMKLKHNENFEIAPNVFLIGDGSGISRGLSQAGAMGLYVGDKIIGKQEVN